MSDVITNMKVRFGADTKQFKKGMDDGKRAVQTFKNDAGGALEQFANHFGVSLRPLSSVLNKATLATKGLSSGMKGAATSTNIFTGALKIMKTALIATGVGALVVALGTLITYFTKTQRGADKIRLVMSGFEAVIGVLIDRLSAFGEGLFKIFTGKFKEGWDALKNSVKGVGDEIKNEVQSATDLEKALQSLERREIEFIRTKQQQAEAISDLILKTRDENISGEERLKYILRAQQIQKEISDEEFAIAAERTRIMREQQALGENMLEDDRELAEAEANLNTIRREGNDKMRELVNRYNEMTNKINAQNKAIIANRKALTKDFKELKPQTLDLSVDADLNTDKFTLEFDKLARNLKTGLEPAQNLILDFASTFNATFSGLAVSFGESMGAIISGTGSLKDFGHIVLSALGDLAIQVGKIAVGTGIAMIGIKEALINIGNPFLAIAGGVALIALGTAVKGALSSAANGTTSGTFSGNSGVFDTRTPSERNTGQTYIPRAIPVHVTGEFRQRGSDMVATINQTNAQNKYKG